MYSTHLFHEVEKEYPSEDGYSGSDEGEICRPEMANTIRKAHSEKALGIVDGHANEPISVSAEAELGDFDGAVLNSHLRGRTSRAKMNRVYTIARNTSNM